MGNHPANMVRLTPEMKGSLTAFTKPLLTSLPLMEELLQWHIAGSEYTQIPMQW
jgi:hypothetical protein